MTELLTDSELAKLNEIQRLIDEATPAQRGTD